MPWSTVGSQDTKSSSKILDKVVPCCPVLCLLNNISQFPTHEKCVWLSGLTAAKEMLVVRWKPPLALSLDYWWHLVLDILTLELSVAQSHGAKEKTLKSWSEAITVVRTMASGSPGGSLRKEGGGRFFYFSFVQHC